MEIKSSGAKVHKESRLLHLLGQLLCFLLFCLKHSPFRLVISTADFLKKALSRELKSPVDSTFWTHVTLYFIIVALKMPSTKPLQKPWNIPADAPLAIFSLYERSLFQMDSESLTSSVCCFNKALQHRNPSKKPSRNDGNSLLSIP